MTRLSLAVAAVRPQPAELSRFLDDLAAAGLEADDEVVIAAGTADAAGLRQALGERPGLELLTYPPEHTAIQLWGHAMARTRGSHVGVLDASDGLAASWVQGWAAAPRDALVCGPVDPDALEGGTSWAAYLSEYGQFRAPLEIERLEEVPGNNLVLPRELMPEPADLDARGFWKTFHLERLRGLRGRLPLVVANDMLVIYRRSYRLGPYLRRRVIHGRCYAGSRLDEPNAPPRLACLVFTPALPLLRTARVWRRIRAGGTRWRHPVGALVPLVLGESAWALGEALGYAFGAGDACERL